MPKAKKNFLPRRGAAGASAKISGLAEFMAQKAQAAMVIFSVSLHTPFYAAVSAAVKVSQTPTGLSTPFDRHRAMLAWLCAGSCAKRKKSTNIEPINAI